VAPDGADCVGVAAGVADDVAAEADADAVAAEADADARAELRAEAAAAEAEAVAADAEADAAADVDGGAEFVDPQPAMIAATAIASSGRQRVGLIA